MDQVRLTLIMVALPLKKWTKLMYTFMLCIPNFNLYNYIEMLIMLCIPNFQVKINCRNKINVININFNVLSCEYI